MLSCWIFGTIAVSGHVPGYEDVLYCPPETCITNRLGLGEGFTGPRRAFWVCLGKATTTDFSSVKAQDVFSPFSWGEKLPNADEHKSWYQSHGFLPHTFE